jgi:hypothetical protein
MKKYFLIMLAVSQFAFAECSVKNASLLANEHVVGNIENLRKVITTGKCVVDFDITVDGIPHHLHESETGLEQEESLCYYAKERARKNLLLDLGGTFQSEAVISCKEGSALPPKIKKGDIILENEVAKYKVKKYFTYKGSQCRMFQEHYTIDRELREYRGVICQVDGSDTNWLVVDKW